MTIIEALIHSEQGLRISNGGRWLVFDNDISQWVVYERKYGQKKTRALIKTDIQDAAVAVLLN